MAKHPWTHTKAKAGYRPDLRRSFRSSLEADCARYLDALLRRGWIRAWRYEATMLTFTVRGKRVGYLLDFEVEHADGRMQVIETKGKLDPRSRMKLRLAREAGHDVLLMRRSTLEALRRRDQVSSRYWEGR